MTSAPRVVAIDGPAGSGKSTLARGLARRLGLPYVNTGSMYRALTALALRRGVDADDGPGLAALISDLRFTLDRGSPPALEIEGMSGSDLTTLEVERTVSAVARHPQVRAALQREQRALGELHGAVMEGRDIGTVVFPDARVKLFLEAGLETRAARRDAHTNPLEPAPGAAVIRTGERTVEETLAAALEVVRERAPELLS